MFKALFVPLQLSFSIFACLFATPLVAQVTSDDTVNTRVNTNGNVAEIIGGETREGNLFHSFQDFSVPTGNEAFFNNADQISNIFSRVTGGNISNIDGLISANGSASLFLINPAGIIFGENASLNLGGSFYGSTASSILFDGGEFSAVNNLEQPILTVNAPIGLSFRDNPREIINRSLVQDSTAEIVGLEVNQGNTLALIGGDLNFEAGQTTAQGGNIYLGGLAEAGVVNLNQDASLSFPQNLALADVALTNGANADVRGTGGGNVTVDAQNLTLEAGESDGSSIRSGIISESTSPEAQAGNVVINVAENTRLNDSGITNQVNAEGMGNSGNITINTGSLELINGGGIDASARGQGNAGAVSISATGDITADGENSAGVPSGITSLVDSDAEGDAGGVTISTFNLDLTNGGRVSASTFGQGNAGTVSVAATGDISADGEDSDGFSSGITSLVNPDAVGDAGGVTISTSNLNLNNGGRISANTSGQGNAGAINITATGDISADGENSDGFPSGITSQVGFDAVGEAGGINISASNLNLTNGGRVDASTGGRGNAGAVSVTATGNITADGENSDGVPSGITSAVDTNAEGSSGGITISTSNLNLFNGGRVDASTGGQGNAEAIIVTATGDITVDGENSDGVQSRIASVVGSGAVGDAAGVTISTSNLNLTNGGQVIADTFGRGNAGAVNIIATGDTAVDGENSSGFPSIISSQVNSDAVGDAAGVTISTSDLNLTNGGRVSGNTFGQGNSGAVNVTATGDIAVDGENSDEPFSGISSQVSPDAIGNAGGVTISSSNLNLTNGGRVDASTGGQGNAGAINITAKEVVTADGENSSGLASGIFSVVDTDAEGSSGGISISTSNLNLSNDGVLTTSTSGQGNAGGIIISTNNFNLLNGGSVDATTFGQGNAGEINITATENVIARGDNSDGFSVGITSAVFTDAVGDAGGITISTNNFNLSNGSALGTSTFGQGNAGGITISTNNFNLSNGSALVASTSGQGNAGDITISANNFNLFNGGAVDASTIGQGNASDINITATESISINGFAELARSGISANAFNEDGNGGNVSINTGSLTIANGGTIEATNFDNIGNDDLPGTGRPGSIDIVANSIELDDSARIEAATQFADGVSGVINLQVSEDIILKNNSFISAQAFGNANGGNLTIDARYVIAFPSNGTGNDLIATAQEGSGGNIEFNVDQLFGLEQRDAVNENNDFLTNNTNDLDVSGIVDGDITINTLDFNPLRVTAELPTNTIDTPQTTQQACQVNREQIANGGLVISGKGGIPPEPSLPLNSANIYVNGESNHTKAIPAPIETAQGKIQPARGVKVTKSGEIMLTAYRTNNVGERIPQIERECG
ncbi:MAG: filamentous hemagglutinin N-terminal domain-containing protein [Cyanobacteria bacterium P01_G01_bin.39]